MRDDGKRDRRVVSALRHTRVGRCHGGRALRGDLEQRAPARISHVDTQSAQADAVGAHCSGVDCHQRATSDDDGAHHHHARLLEQD